MIYTRNGKLKYNENFLDIINSNKMASSHNNRRASDDYKFQSCNFKHIDLEGKEFSNVIFDESDFTRANLRNCVFNNCGFRASIFYRTELDGSIFNSCNFVEAKITESFLRDAEFIDCNMNSVTFEKSLAQYASWDRCELRKTNFRDSNCKFTKWTNNDFKGMNSRGCRLGWSNAPSFMSDQTFDKKYLPSDYEYIGYKLTNENAQGIYHPLITYKVGEYAHPENQDNGFMKLDEKTNPGIAIADLTWALKEWVSLGAPENYRLFEARFKISDMIDFNHAGKYNVRKVYISKELNMQEFAEMITQG